MTESITSDWSCAEAQTAWSRVVWSELTESRNSPLMPHAMSCTGPKWPPHVTSDCQLPAVCINHRIIIKCNQNITLPQFQSSLINLLCRKWYKHCSVKLAQITINLTLIVLTYIRSQGTMYKVMKTYVCRGSVNPVTGTGCTSVDIGVNANLALVDKFWYLGNMLSVDGDADAAVETRIWTGWKKFRQLVPLLTKRI